MIRVPQPVVLVPQPVVLAPQPVVDKVVEREVSGGPLIKVGNHTVIGNTSQHLIVRAI